MPCQRPSLIFRMDLNSLQIHTARQDFKTVTVVKDEAYKSVITLLCLADFTIFYGAAKLQTTVLAYRSLILCNFTLSMSHNLEDFSSLSHWKSTNKSHLICYVNYQICYKIVANFIFDPSRPCYLTGRKKEKLNH